MSLVEVSDVHVHFPVRTSWRGPRAWIRAVDGVSLSIERGESVGLVGGSGSGKTTLGQAILGLVRTTSGSIRFDGTDTAELSPGEWRALRQRMQVIFQDPYSSLNPRMSIRQLLAEPLLVHGLARASEVDARVAELLDAVGMEAYFMHRYPHEFSGGQRQRIAIARALSLKPEFIVCDEPVSALDVSVQASVLEILETLQRQQGIALLFISHDLSVVERVADRVAVMCEGKIVETGPTAGIIGQPQHDYTRQLLAAVPEIP